MPNDVVGFAKGNFMNVGSGLAIYAAVCKELGHELPFPGAEVFYTMYDTFTDAKLHAEFCAWAVLHPDAGNEAFNVVNGDVESWQNLWPKIAKYFNLTIPADQFSRAAPLAVKTDLQVQPPISIQAKSIGLEGRTPQSSVSQRINLVQWSQTSEVKKAWKRIADREGLSHDTLAKATWGFVDFVLGRDYNVVQSMSKARQMGWNGYLDTWQSFKSLFEVLEKEGVIPKTH